MNKSLYLNLAKNNIKNNKNTYFPFGLSCITMIALFYMMVAISKQVVKAEFYGGSSMAAVLYFGSIVVGVFSVCVVFYTNSFLMKRRTKELGLYSVLGLEKKHICKVLLLETIIVGGGSIVIGVIAGVLFSKLMYLVFLNLVRIQSTVEFEISVEAIVITLVMFICVFILTIIYNNIRVAFLKPIELLNGSKVGEKEPKAKWILALLGFVCLGIGYYIAITTKSPLEAMFIFFIAVLFVIAGTYLIFISGSIAILKLLQKNKKYYYHKTHFISVSGMMYRMKQNAVGLANICILSTMVLVVLTTTFSLYIGIDDVMKGLYPKEVLTDYIYYPEDERAIPDEGLDVSYDEQLKNDTINEQAKKYDVTVKDVQSYYDVSASGSFKDGAFTADYSSKDLPVILNLITEDDYNKLSGQNVDLGDNEILLYSDKSKIKEYNEIQFGDQFYSVNEKLEEFPISNKLGDAYGRFDVVVKDFDQLLNIRDICNSMLGDDNVTKVLYNYRFNLEGDLENKVNFCNDLRDAINNAKIAHVKVVDNIYTSRDEIMSIYGSVFFIGLFIGTVFIIVTVLIIYYKQLSEGHDDRNRFIIMQKVGMSKPEVKKVIRGQILSVFFLPIILAIIHIIFAFDIIKKILLVLGLANVGLYICCMIITVIVFVTAYAIVYMLTAKTYYKLVNN